MKRIYKYNLALTDVQTVQLPKDAKLLTVQVQHGNISLWAMVDETAPLESRTIRIYGTGHSVLEPDDMSYLGTVQLQGGNLVFHVFEKQEPLN